MNLIPKMEKRFYLREREREDLVQGEGNIGSLPRKTLEWSPYKDERKKEAKVSLILILDSSKIDKRYKTILIRKWKNKERKAVHYQLIPRKETENNYFAFGFGSHRDTGSDIFFKYWTSQGITHSIHSYSHLLFMSTSYSHIPLFLCPFPTNFFPMHFKNFIGCGLLSSILFFHPILKYIINFFFFDSGIEENSKNFALCGADL